VSDPVELTTKQEALLQIIAGLVPATAQEVAAALGKLSVDLRDIVVELTAADEACDEAIEAHDDAYDHAFLDAGFDPKNPALKVTEKVREATARTQTFELRVQMDSAKRELRRLKRIHDTLDRRIFVGQSIAKTVRSEHNTIGYGQWGATG
jgi:hypothetical protein